jgi:hypothetical protein
MWEKLNKIQAQVIAAMVIIASSLGLAYLAAICGLPDSSLIFINKVTDVALLGAIAWLFTASKNGNGSPKP